MRRLTITIPRATAAAETVAAEETDPCNPSARWTADGLAFAYVDTTDTLPVLEFWIQCADGTEYILPEGEDLQWVIGVSAYGYSGAHGPTIVATGDSTFEATVPPGAANLEGVAIIEIGACVGGVGDYVVGPYLVALDYYVP